MKLNIKRLLKDSLISFTILGMIGGSINSNVANAKHRGYHYRTHWSYHHTSSKALKLARRQRPTRVKGNEVYWGVFGSIITPKLRHTLNHRWGHSWYRYSLHRRNRKNYRQHAKKYYRRHHYYSYRKSRKSYKHPKYMWVARPNNGNKYIRVRVVGKRYMNGERDEPYYIYKANNKVINANGWKVRHGYGAAWGEAKDQVAYIYAHKPVVRHHSSNNGNISNSQGNTAISQYKDSNIQDNLPEFRSEMMSLINQDRADSTGKAPLQESSALDQIAQIRAKDASTPAQENQSDPHMDPDTNKAYYQEVGNQLGYNVDAFGSDNHSASGENLAWDDVTPKDFNNAWYTQEKSYNGGHYQNIVGDTSTTAHYRLVGIGVYHNTGAEVFAENVTNN